MSYQYDENTKRYVLNTSYVSTPTHSSEPMAPQSSKSTREPVVFRISSKSRMSSFEDPRPETAQLYNTSATIASNNQQLLSNNSNELTVVDSLKSDNIKFGFKQDRSLSTKSHTSLHAGFMLNGSVTDRGNQTNEAFNTSSFRKDNIVQDGVATTMPQNSSIRQSVPPMPAFPSSVRDKSNVVKLSMTQPTRFTVTSTPFNSNEPAAPRNQPIRISDIKKLQQAQLLDYQQTKKEQERKEKQRLDHEEQLKRNQDAQSTNRSKEDQIEKDKKQWVDYIRREKERNERDLMELQRKQYERQQTQRRENERKQRQKRQKERRQQQKREQQKRDQIKQEFERKEQERKQQKRLEQEKREQQRRQQGQRQQQRRDQQKRDQQIRQQQQKQQKEQERSRLSSSYVGPMNNNGLLRPNYATSMNSSLSTSTVTQSPSRQSLAPSLNTAQLLTTPNVSTPHNNPNLNNFNSNNQNINNQPQNYYSNNLQSSSNNQSFSSNQSSNQAPTNNSMAMQQQQRINRLEQENSNLRTEVRKLTNEQTLTKAKMSSLESNTKHEVDNLRSLNKNLDDRHKELEQMKRDIEATLTNRTTISASQVVKKIEKLLNENKAQSEKIRNRETENASLISELRTREEEIHGLRNMVKMLEDNNHHLKSDFEKERKNYLEACRQLEEGKAQMRRLKDELTRNDYQGLWESNEAGKQRVLDLTRQLEQTRLQVRRAKEEAATHNLQRVREESEADRRRVIELTRECEQLRTKTYELERNLQLSEAKHPNPMSSAPSSASVSRQSSYANLQKLVVECPQQSDAQTTKQLKFVQSQLERQRANCAKLTKIVGELNTNINNLNLNLAKFKGDFNALTFLHTSKQKELSSILKKAQAAEQKHLERMKQFEGQIEVLENQLQCKEEEYKYEFRLLRKELEEARSNWCDRIVTSMSFDVALKELLQQIQNLKRKLTNEQQNSIMLKEKLWACQSENNNLNSELKLQRMKNASEKKTLESSHELALQDMANQLAKAERLAESLSNKIKQLADQNKGKDVFIVKTLMGRQLAQHDKLDLQEFFQEFQEIVPIKDHKKKLEHELQQIEQLEQSNRELVRELSAAQ